MAKDIFDASFLEQFMNPADSTGKVFKGGNSTMV